MKKVMRVVLHVAGGIVLIGISIVPMILGLLYRLALNSFRAGIDNADDFTRWV